MGDILAFPCRSKDRQHEHGVGQNAPAAPAHQFSKLNNTQFSIVKALLFSLASLETAMAALTNALIDLPAGDRRDRFLKQQTAFAAMIYQAQRMLAEYDP
jgi:hypothetical protein